VTSKTKSDRFRRLISHGFMAPELPPCFVSEDLAKFRVSLWKSITELPPRSGGQPEYYRFKSEPCCFYFPRYGRNDRKHGVLNPISYLAISKVIADNYVRLRGKAKLSKLSASPPIFDWNGQRAIMRPSVDLRDQFRVDLASRSEYFAVADIRAFFHSIYTHAIPWAIYGKAWAKRNRGLSHFGNLLDLLCRNAQDGQTVGLPVGPDTSRLLAEVIASAVDVELRKKLGLTVSDASRYVDDYTIGGEGSTSGEALIAGLRQAASLFELELNNDKSLIQRKSPQGDIGWKQAALAYVPQLPYDKDGFHRFFYEVERVSREHPDINVEKYAYLNARRAFVHTDAWKDVQSHLINAYRLNPSLVGFLVEVILLREVEYGDVDANTVKVFVERRIKTLTDENRTGEIIWLLFLSIRLQLNLSAIKLKPLFEIENSFIALLVTYASKHDLVAGEVDYSLWTTHINEAGLYGPMWLYVYESTRQRICPIDEIEFMTQDKYFAPLLEKNVSFFSILEGFSSMASVNRSRRGENRRMEQVRNDFLDDLDIDIEEFDDMEDDDFEEGDDYY